MLAGAPASAIFCAADPIIPPCCPTPCPVFDAVRVPKLLADVAILGQAIDADAKVVQSMVQLGQTIGDTKAMVTSVARELSAFPTTISSEVTAVQSGLSSNPIAALGALKQTMFEAGARQDTAAQASARESSRIAAAQDEQAAAFALSLSKSNSLPSSSFVQSQVAATVAASDQLHADFAANSTARLAFYQDIGGLHQLAAAWLSHRASKSALAHPNTAGGAEIAPAASASPAAPEALPQTFQSTADQLISLHDSRVSAQTLLSAYPALQQTVASAELADQFASAAEKKLQEGLSALGAGSDATIAHVEQALRDADTTGWLDGNKDLQAQQAGAQVLLGLAAGGSVSRALVSDGSSMGQQLQQAMASWLDANKQSQYWAQLAQSAKSSIADLDRSLGMLSDQAGVDLTNSSAVAAETMLLNKLKQDPSASGLRGLIAAASQDPGARTVLQRTVTQ